MGVLLVLGLCGLAAGLGGKFFCMAGLIVSAIWLKMRGRDEE